VRWRPERLEAARGRSRREGSPAPGARWSGLGPGSGLSLAVGSIFVAAAAADEAGRVSGRRVTGSPMLPSPALDRRLARSEPSAHP
jgi:hypothetical protein